MKKYMEIIFKKLLLNTLKTDDALDLASMTQNAEKVQVNSVTFNYFVVIRLFWLYFMIWML